MTIKKKQKEKDKIGVVNEIPCHKCENSYIRETGRTLSKRTQMCILFHEHEQCHC